jgi:hypothetical protein
MGVGGGRAVARVAALALSGVVLVMGVAVARMDLGQVGQGKGEAGGGVGGGEGAGTAAVGGSKWFRRVRM